MKGFGPGEGTWTCHVCGEERPDAQISVRKHKHSIEGTLAYMDCNVRYCNDRAPCIEASFTTCHMNKPIEP